MSRKTEIQVGVTVLVAIAILLWGVALLSTLARAHIQRVWYVSFPQGGGLAEGNEAHVNGVRKGVVKSLRLVGDRVVAELALARDIQLTHDSRVVIRSVSMMGDKIIAVDYHGTGAPWSPRDTIPGVYEKGLPEVMADVGRASGSVATIARQLDSLAVAMNQGGGLAAAVAGFQRTSRDLESAVAENRAALRATMQNFEATSRSAKGLVVDHEAQLRGALDDFAAAAANLDRLSGRLDSLRAVLHGVAAQLDRGEGTAGRLLKDERLYDELTAAARELRTILADLQAHPRKYFKFSVF
jgi:phospholipid/cholesterol/gamma-HCH transport system substrate-binding protein